MHVALPKTRTGSSGVKLPPGEQRIGFLAAGRDESLGYVGGYLLTTARGRPLEFHYTTPVKPSATHRILYGVELEPYIFGELIAANLIRQSAIEPSFIITDQPRVLDQRPASSCPILCVAPEAAATAETADAAEKPRSELVAHADYPQDADSLTAWLAEANPGLNVREPFGRLWAAVREVLSGDAKLAA